MAGGFGCHEMASARNCIFAAIVRFGTRGALALEAALHCFTSARSSGETVERPDQQKNCQKADDDLSVSPHFYSSAYHSV